ncbi:hypothetical protein [Frankia sp. AiPa1]|uniref:hypothetical protein n=1 Tax=Frankia sp. AiPa1 TaxID=573492 RepID=UPI00202AF7AC|nr:hypothetical protein [Frankia sp. AiPa1]
MSQAVHAVNFLGPRVTSEQVAEAPVVSADVDGVHLVVHSLDVDEYDDVAAVAVPTETPRNIATVHRRMATRFMNPPELDIGGMRAGMKEDGPPRSWFKR